MRCEGCRALMVKEKEQWLDERRELQIRAWRCTGCDGRMEEIRIEPKRGGAEGRCIRYAVRENAA
jgi:hypothetical protein